MQRNQGDMNEMSDRVVMTVLGPVPAGALGKTVVHEHCFVDLRPTFQAPDGPTRGRDLDRPVDMSMVAELQQNPFSTTRDNLVLDDEALCIEELDQLVQAGGNTVVDPTCTNMGRQPLALQRVSRATGLNIVAMTGFYVEPAHPDWVSEKTADQLAGIMISEFEDGIDGTDVRPGAIGEIGLGGRPKGSGMKKTGAFTAEEEKVLRAAGRASLQTGLVITIHTDAVPPHPALPAIDILEEEGVSPSRIVIDHLDRVDGLDFHRSVVDRGVYVEYDGIGRNRPTFGVEMSPDWGHDGWRATFVKHLIDEGHGGQLLFSHDVCAKCDLHKYGGTGYAHMFGGLLPMLREGGVSDAAIHDILVTNPARAFGIEYDATK